jgi:hypothetical protein
LRAEIVSILRATSMTTFGNRAPSTNIVAVTPGQQPSVTGAGIQPPPGELEIHRQEIPFLVFGIL